MQSFCNNIGVVNYGKQPEKQLSEKQVQADLLGHINLFIENTRDKNIIHSRIWLYGQAS